MLAKNYPLVPEPEPVVYRWAASMLTTEQINSIHRLHWSEHWSVRKIARHLQRRFIDLTDVNVQARHWLEQVANQRRHRETGQTPEARFQPETLRALPAITPDYRDAAEALVHKDLRLSFDGNRYCVPPRCVGRRLTIKADASAITIHDQYQEIVSYARCWQRGQTLGAERFQKELLAQFAAAQRSAEQQRLVSWLGPASESYLRRLADTDRSLTRQVRELLLLVREYGPDAVAAAVTRAHAAGAFGADYIANLLRQQRTRRDVQPPLREPTARLDLLLELLLGHFLGPMQPGCTIEVLAIPRLLFGNDLCGLLGGGQPGPWRSGDAAIFDDQILQSSGRRAEAGVSWSLERECVMSSIGPKPKRLWLDSVSYEALRRQVLRRDGWRCQSCRTMSNLEVHHRRFGVTPATIPSRTYYTLHCVPHHCASPLRNS